MSQSYLPKSLTKLVVTLIGMALCLSASYAYCSQTDASKSDSSDSGVAAKQVLVQHEHALPSMFRKDNVYLNVSVNDHPGVWMMLDTGTTDSMIDSEYANTIGLKLVQKSEGTGGFGSMKATTFTTDKVNLQVGVEPRKTVFFESIRLSGMVGPDGMQVAGLLGHSFLDKHVIVIDYKKQEVYFDDTAQPGNQRDIAMTLLEGVPVVVLKMADKSVNALIDSGGSYGVIITPATVIELGVESFMADAKLVGAVGHGNEQHIVIGKAPPFSVGDIAVHDLSAAYTTFGTASDALTAGASLGIIFLRNYKLTLNYVANTLRFEP